jgi:hypothetical protein
MAAKLVTAPFEPMVDPDDKGFDEFACSVRFLGTGSQPVTIRAWSGTHLWSQRKVTVSASNPAAVLEGRCPSDDFGIDAACRQFVCVVTVPGAASDYRTSACIKHSGGGIGLVCLPGH